MDDLARAEYPAMLSHLQPNQAVQTLNDRVKKINKLNIDIADWMAERRRIEEQYVMNLRKLAQFRVPNAQSDMGVFHTPWARLIGAVERIAQSHHQFAEGIERDVEHPLRAFQQRPDVQNMHTISHNLGAMAKDLEDAQEKSDKVNKKGGKASAQKADTASAKLESAQQQWESQAPFVFETLQALDESRINQLRDQLTQYQTQESDQASRRQNIASETLAIVIEISTESEIQGFVRSTTADRPALARTSTRRSSNAASAAAPPSASQLPETPSSTRENTMDTSTNQASVPPSVPEEDSFDQSPAPAKPESKLRRLGTILGGRRRQSVHGGFGQLSPSQKGSGTGFGRLGSSQGRGVSPRASASNLNEPNRLSSLAENKTSSPPPRPKTGGDAPSGGANGIATNGSLIDSDAPQIPALSGINGSREVPDVPPPPGPPPSQQANNLASPRKDSEGYTVRAPLNDPITEAQREAAGDDADQPFKMSIQNQPVAEEDPEAKQAALSSVANSLKLGPATQRSGTVRGRRDVRNTVYRPAPNAPETFGDNTQTSPVGPVSPTTGATRPPAVAALASESSVAASDSQSVRSGASLASFAHARHPDMNAPGLNSSVIETVSAQFEDGEVKSVSIAGEIAFVNNSVVSDDSKTHETIRINNFHHLEKIGPNRIFVQNASPDQPDQYALDLSHIAKTSTAFSYRVFADETNPLALSSCAPLLLKPAWKPQGDKLGLLLQYQLNPSCNIAAPVTLHNVVFVATYEGRANGAQTKPSGTHLKDKHLVYWRIGDVTLTSETQKIVCRILGADGSEPTPGHVEARWEYIAPADEGQGALASGISISRMHSKDKGREVPALDDPFADGASSPAGPTGWVDVPLSRKLVSGKYEGK